MTLVNAATAEELEALEYIYYNGIVGTCTLTWSTLSLSHTLLPTRHDATGEFSRTETGVEFALLASSTTPDHQHDEEEEEEEGDKRKEETPLALLHIAFTPSYPETLPIITLSPGTPKSGPFQPQSPENIDLSRHLHTLASESLGIGMIYTLHTAAQEWCEAWVAEQATVHETQFMQGTPVTLDTFQAWKTGFLAEIRDRVARGEGEAELPPSLYAAGMIAGIIHVRVAGKSTGKELFLKDRTLAESDASYKTDGVEVDYAAFEAQVDEEVEEDEDATQGVSTWMQDASLEDD